MPRLFRRHFVGCGCVALAGGLVGGCTVNRATGRSSFTGLMSTREEIAVGADQHPKILEEFGGAYGTARLKSYVNGLGQNLAAAARRAGDVPDPNVKFTFTVLNSPIVNAFALPGGYVYISRGLMALAENEAELAGVLGHEIGHITGRHTAERYSQSVLAQVGLLAAGIGASLLGVPDPGSLMRLGGAMAQSALAGWSRDQELEADTLGVRYLALTGYQPRAMASFLDKLRNDTILQAKLVGRSPEIVDRTHALSTHPRTLDRVELALPEARKYPIQNPRENRDTYLRQIDGMIYGDDPKQGVVCGQDFLHPDLRFAFRVPPGFTFVNGQSSVQAANKDGALIRFVGGRKQNNQSIRDVLASAAARSRVRLQNVEPLTIDGMPAATGTARVNVQGGPVDARLVAIQFSATRVWMFQFFTPRNLTQRMDGPFKRTAFSFRRMSAAEARGIHPMRLRTIAVRSGDTVERLANRMPFDSFKIDRFIVLNDLRQGEPLQVGELVKTITG